MLQVSSDKRSGGSLKKYFISFLLATTAFTCFYIISDALTGIATSLAFSYLEKLAASGVFYVSVGVSMFIGAHLSNELISRKKLIYLWLLLMILFFSFTSVGVEQASSSILAIFSLCWGIAVGLGIPSCLALFAESVAIEKRGRLGGLLAFIFNVSLFSQALLFNVLIYSARIQAFTIWLISNLILSILFKKDLGIVQGIKSPGVSLILRERKFMLYLIPWITFCLINSLEAPILKNFFGDVFFDFAMISELALSGIFAIINGFLTDKFGRKIMAIIGFITLGIGYAFLGIFPNARAFWYLYVVVDSIAWGIFVVLFFLTLWGDLSDNLLKDKFYLLGGLPFLLSWFVQLIIEPYITSISIYAAFSLASFFLFLAVVPLMFAPETLPEKMLRERELRSYIERAKRVREKFTKG
jgi:MFS family permease